MIRVLDEVEELTVQDAPAPAPGSYEVPVVLEMSAQRRAKMDEPR